MDPAPCARSILDQVRLQLCGSCRLYENAMSVWIAVTVAAAIGDEGGDGESDDDHDSCGSWGSDCNEEGATAVELTSSQLQNFAQK